MKPHTEPNLDLLASLAQQEIPLLDKITPRTLATRLKVGTNRATLILEKLVSMGVLETYRTGLGGLAFRLAKKSTDALGNGAASHA